MENIINLEQLDYRDQLIKNYIDERVQPSQSGSGIACELYVYTNKLAEEVSDKHRLYIRCSKGQIKDTDTLQFARNKVSNCIWRDSETNQKQRRKKKGRGWIIPRFVNQVPLTMVYDSVLSDGSDKFDYWEVRPLSPEGNVWTWEQLIDTFLSYRYKNAEWSMRYDDSHNVYSPTYDKGMGLYYNTYANFLNEWCGLAIIRDGSNITPYMKWRLDGGWRIDTEYESQHLGYGYFESDYLADGCSIEWFMNTTYDEYGYGEPYDGRKSSFVFTIK